LSLRLAGVSGEGGAGAVVGEHMVEDVDEGRPVLGGELVELGEPLAEQVDGRAQRAAGRAVDEQVVGGDVEGSVAGNATIENAQSWNQLTQQMQNALVRAGLANRHGGILG
jgi:hypothetical protein